MEPINIRPRASDDDARLVAIFRAINPDRAPLTVEEFRHNFGSIPERAEHEFMVAERSGDVVGLTFWNRRIYSTDPDSWVLAVTVDPRLWRQGIGSTLYERGLTRIHEQNARKLFTYVREDRPESEAFARRRGFEPTGFGDRHSRLEVRSANLDRSRETTRRVEESGIRIIPLAELDPDEEMLRAIYEMDNASAKDIPSSEPWNPWSFEEWRKHVLETPNYRPEAFWVALDGERPVGLAFLEMRAGNIADNGYTGTAPTHRNRGIARALEFRTVKWARANGIEYIVTGNDVNNKPMLAINVEMGYKPLPANVEMMKEL